MPISSQEKWNVRVSENKDPYGKACVDTARRVMEILDGEEKEIDTHEIISRADEEVGAGGLTGFMAGAVAQMVVECHSRSEEFREKWNTSYNYSGKGVVNPAILTVEL